MSEEAAGVAQSAGVNLERLVVDSADKIFSRVPFKGKIKIEVGANASRVVPEIGVGGTIDPGKGDVFLVVTDEAISKQPRPDGPGFGLTLGEALVSSGLSDHFVEEMFPATPPQPWNHRKLSEVQETNLWRRAKRDLDIPGGYDHPLWFFGAGGKNALPRWAGYTLAYRIVNAYTDDEHRATEAVGIRSSTVIKPYAHTHD